MTLNLFKKILNTDSNNPKELLSLLDNAKNEGNVDELEYTLIKSDIKIQYSQLESNQGIKKRVRYTKEEVLTVLQSHLDVYDGIKDISAHLNLMIQLFGRGSAQYRNGAQSNRSFHRTLNEGKPNLGQSMPANWADATLELIQNRPVEFQNTLDACQKIYDSTDNKNMLRVIQKWKYRKMKSRIL